MKIWLKSFESLVLNCKYIESKRIGGQKEWKSKKIYMALGAIFSALPGMIILAKGKQAFRDIEWCKHNRLCKEMLKSILREGLF